MKKLALAALVVLLAGLSSATLATDTPFGNWGTNYTDGQNASGSHCTGIMLLTDHPDWGWVFLSQGANDPWESYANITLDLYVEGFATMCYRYLNYEFHCIPDGVNDCFYFEIDMMVTGNVNAMVGIQPLQGGQALTHLEWKSNLGLHEPTTITDFDDPIPIQWWGYLEPGSTYLPPIGTFDPLDPPTDYLPLEPLSQYGGSILLPVEPCDHVAKFIGYFCVWYHARPGWWQLVFAGCPVPEI